MNIQFGDAKEDVTPPTSTDDISSVITTGTDAPNQLFIESNEVTLRNLERFSKIDFVEAEFESGGYYSNFTIERIFQTFYNENEQNNSDVNIFTCIETSMLIDFFQTMPPDIALRQALENKEVKFDKNFLLCPIFSTRKMKLNNTLIPFENDNDGHWLLLFCDFFEINLMSLIVSVLIMIWYLKTPF